MIDVRYEEPATVFITGRFDAAQVETVRPFMEKLTGTATAELGGLEYISSAGLGVLVATQRRLKDGGGELVLKNLNGYVRDIFKIARFDLIFTIK